MPPAGDSTSPRRRCATRNPAARAGSAAASHRPQTAARNPPPIGAVSSTGACPSNP